MVPLRDHRHYINTIPPPRLSVRRGELARDDWRLEEEQLKMVLNALASAQTGDRLRTPDM